MDIFGQFRAADSLFRLLTGDMEHVTSYPFQPRKRKAWVPSAVMPMGIPEEQGVSSRTIAEFFRRMDEDNTLCPHGVVILRHGQRIAEGVWNPYSSKIPQMQFSLSKRECEVLETLLKSDKNVKEIAQELYISRAALYRHISNMNEKTDTKSREGLIKFYYQWEKSGKN